ncbi:MAG: hypothetical protein RSI06_09635 [Lachnospiraceae bacterium]
MANIRTSKDVFRIISWNIRNNLKVIVFMSVGIFLLLFAYAKFGFYMEDISDIYERYLGGSSKVDVSMIAWVVFTLPIKASIYFYMTAEYNELYSIKILKYQDKRVHRCIVLISIALQTAIYYAICYGLFVIINGTIDIKFNLFQISLVIVETLNFSISAFLIWLVWDKARNFVFPLILSTELIACVICGGMKGGFRFLPFTQGKFYLQQSYYTNGVSILFSVVMLCILVGGLVLIDMRLDERGSNNGFD